MLTPVKIPKKSKLRMALGGVLLVLVGLSFLLEEHLSLDIMLALFLIILPWEIISTINDARKKYYLASDKEKKRMKKSLRITIVFSMITVFLIVFVLVTDKFSPHAKANIFLGILIVIVFYLAYNLFIEFKYSRPKAKELSEELRRKQKIMAEELLKELKKGDR